MDFDNLLRTELNKKLKEEVAYLVVDDSITDVKLFIPTGAEPLDLIATNQENGGIPVGKITTIEGLESTGKSLMAMQIMANAQKMGGLAIYVDSERALNTDFAQRVGLDTTKDFLHVFPPCVEDVFNTINVISETLHKEEEKAKKEKREPQYKFAVIIWDSVASTQTKLDLEAQNPDPASSIGVKARTLSKNIPSLLTSGWRNNIAFVFVNQLRLKIGAMPGQDKYEAPGGKAIPYYSSLRIRLTSIGKLKNAANDIVGIQTLAKVYKTRFGPPHRETKFPIYFTHGIDNEESIIEELILKEKVIKKSGGAAGTFLYFASDGEDTKIPKSDFKMKLFNDQKFKQKASKALSECMIRELSDPRKSDLQIDSNVEDLE